MSLNIYIQGKRQAVAKNKFGKPIEFTDTRKFSCFQTPTTVSRAIMAAGDIVAQLAAYRKYIEDECSESFIDPVYADDDFMCEGDPIGEHETNYGRDHLAELDEFLAMCDEEGFEVEVYMM